MSEGIARSVGAWSEGVERGRGARAWSEAVGRTKSRRLAQSAARTAAAAMMDGSICPWRSLRVETSSMAFACASMSAGRGGVPLLCLGSRATARRAGRKSSATARLSRQLRSTVRMDTSAS